jgi:hypothetical protein
MNRKLSPLLQQKRIYDCRIQSSKRFCAIAAAFIATLLSALLLPRFANTSVIAGNLPALYSGAFITMFLVCYVAIRQWYGIRIWIDSAEGQSDPCTLWIRGVRGNSATAIPVSAITSVEACIFEATFRQSLGQQWRGSDDDVYVHTQPGYRGRGLLITYALSASQGAADNAPRRFRVPVCDPESAIRLLSPGT